MRQVICRWVIAAIMMTAVWVIADPRPSYPYTTDAADAKSLEALIAENPATFAPIVKVALQGSGGSVAVDPVGVVEASKGRGGVLGHFQRNWGKWLTGTAATGVLIWANNRDWWQEDGSSVSSEVTYTGHSVNVSTGNDSPVTINIGVSDAEESEE